MVNFSRGGSEIPQTQQEGEQGVAPTPLTPKMPQKGNFWGVPMAVSPQGGHQSHPQSPWSPQFLQFGENSQEFSGRGG